MGLLEFFGGGKRGAEGKKTARKARTQTVEGLALAWARKEAKSDPALKRQILRTVLKLPDEEPIDPLKAAEAEIVAEEMRRSPGARRQVFEAYLDKIRFAGIRGPAGEGDDEDGSDLDRALEIYERLDGLANRRSRGNAAPREVSDVAYIVGEAVKPGGALSGISALLPALLQRAAAAKPSGEETTAGQPEPKPARPEIGSGEPAAVQAEPTISVSVEPVDPASATIDDDPFAAAEAAFETFLGFADGQEPFVRGAILAVMASLVQAEDSQVIAFLGQYEEDPTWHPLIDRLRKDAHWASACLARLRRLIGEHFGIAPGAAESEDEEPAVAPSRNGHRKG